MGELGFTILDVPASCSTSLGRYVHLWVAIITSANRKLEHLAKVRLNCGQVKCTNVIVEALHALVWPHADEPKPHQSIAVQVLTRLKCSPIISVSSQYTRLGILAMLALGTTSLSTLHNVSILRRQPQRQTLSERHLRRTSR
jgi:hypothetical protein